MPKLVKSAEEIREEIQRLVDAAIGDDEDAIEVHAPIALAEPDSDGCNWYVAGFTGDQGYWKLVGNAVLAVKAKWNMG